MVVASLVPLQATALALTAVGALAVVASRDTLKMILLNGLYSWTLTLLFVIFGAPDVALSMIIVGAVAYPVVVLIAIARARAGRPEAE